MRLDPPLCVMVSCYLRMLFVFLLFTSNPLRTASGSSQPKVSMSLCTQAGRGVTIVSPSSAPLGAIVPGPDFNKPLTVCSSAVPASSQPAAVVTAQTATGQQPKVPLHVSSQMTVNQARNAVRTGKWSNCCLTELRRQKENFEVLIWFCVIFAAACHSQDRPTAAVTPIQSATPVTYLPHLAVCPQPSSSPAQGCARIGVAMSCAAVSLTPPNVSAASLEGDILRPVPVLAVPVGSGNNAALHSSSNNAVLACRLDKDSKVSCFFSLCSETLRDSLNTMKTVSDCLWCHGGECLRFLAYD